MIKGNSLITSHSAPSREQFQDSLSTKYSPKRIPEKRSRTLPAHLVVYFVLALALFTDGYEEVIRKLVNGLRFARVWSGNGTSRRPARYPRPGKGSEQRR